MTDKKEMLKTINGFPLFNEIEDASLRRRNQAVILTNILEDGFVKGKIKAKSSLLMLSYFNALPIEERAPVRLEFINQANQRGFSLE